jgi:hypothetical protein
MSRTSGMPQRALPAYHSTTSVNTLRIEPATLAPFCVEAGRGARPTAGPAVVVVDDAVGVATGLGRGRAS